ncbi:MAG: hypothetical protein CM15mP103_03300 [Gammaproteobacteria bacterium]|nr:MAG: hypothetical protein CM15mP103_03300 [Gammaproteobacteria bacterium]
MLALILTSRGWEGSDPIRVASTGILIGIMAFAAVIMSAPLQDAGAVSNWCSFDWSG